ncbi:hypothetical protein [Paenibacillus cremeus]|uniref:Uncharacterized protein n=1 Tax=Paenibacillus cremeus TaxID=2163881 RepID=A0A559KCI8_9BACL|nr:hypothetical protein [Paenibacillus cremeus]TVY09823.1 hypothetical protein FPZ49_10635 [Paenibacillus cremeus]
MVENQKYYIAKVGSLWVHSCYSNICSVNLQLRKQFATHIKEEDIKWLQAAIPSVEIIEVNVTIEETLV